MKNKLDSFYSTLLEELVISVGVYFDLYENNPLKKEEIFRLIYSVKKYGERKERLKKQELIEHSMLKDYEDRHNELTEEIRNFRI